MSDPIVGIDLGTSNSVVAYADETGQTRVLADEGGYKIHPSVVSFHPNGGVVVGAAAKQRKVIDPSNTIYSVKRLIGRAYSSPEVKTAKKRSPFQIKEGANELPLIVTRGGEFAVPEISAIVLDHVRNIAAHQLGDQVTRAVVTVPASFNDAQRSATATAGAIAGITVVRVLNEPTAAALAYGATRTLNQTIAVYDFGGGTFDITILRLEDQVYTVLGTAGDTFLGGDDLDERLVDRMVEKFLKENRIDLRTNEISMMRLRAVAEQTKIELSRRSRAVVRIDEIAYGPKGAPLNLQIEITRDEFVSQVADIIDRTFPVCKEALSYAQMGTKGIDDIILVGGTTKIPYVRDQVSKFFAKAPRTDVNPEDAVAVGAALQATSLERILNRKPSQRLSAQLAAQNAVSGQIDDDDAFSGETNTVDSVFGGGPTENQLDLEDPDQEQTNISRVPEPPPGKQPLQEAPPSYSLPRTGTREVFESKTPPPQPTHGTIARLKPPPKPPGPSTAPMGAVGRSAPNSPTQVGEAPKPPPLPKPRTQPGMAAIDLRTASGSAARSDKSDLAIQRPEEFPADNETTAMAQKYVPSPSANPSATTLMSSSPPVPSQIAPPQMAPPPLAPPPVAATTSKGFSPLDLELELAAAGAAAVAQSAASTAKGFPAPQQQYPQQFPVMPQPAPHAQPTIAMQAPVYPPPQQQPYQPPPAYAQPTMVPQPAPVYQPPPPAPMPEPPRPPPVILDVTPRSLGIATVSGYCEELIRRNSRLPTEMKKLFTTSRDKQDAVRIVVCQGESRRLDNNTVIGDLRLEGIPARPRGETSIEVTFQLDASGILQVKARDSKTGREQNARLALVGDVSQEDVEAARERMQQLRR